MPWITIATGIETSKYRSNDNNKNNRNDSQHTADRPQGRYAPLSRGPVRLAHLDRDPWYWQKRKRPVF
jgi:hypothetical protein